MSFLFKKKNVDVIYKVKKVKNILKLMFSGEVKIKKKKRKNNFKPGLQLIEWHCS
jgi:hypothetical protein